MPLESSVSYGAGTANGPAAIIEASTQLELLNGGKVPAEAGIHTGDPVDCSGPVTKILDRIEDAVAYALECEAMPLVLGGEHTVTLGALRAMKQHRRIGVVQFDAHADLRNTFDGSPYSHACVMRRAVEDLGLPLFQIGVRALCEEEEAYRKAADIPHLNARELFLKGIPGKLLPPDFPDRIYVTFDVDGFDPSVIRATGTRFPAVSAGRRRSRSWRPSCAVEPWRARTWWNWLPSPATTPRTSPRPSSPTTSWGWPPRNDESVFF